LFGARVIPGEGNSNVIKRDRVCKCDVDNIKILNKSKINIHEKINIIVFADIMDYWNGKFQLSL